MWKNTQLLKYTSHSCLFSSATSLETALSVAVGEKAAPHILRSVSFMNCELQYPKPGNHSDVEKYRSVLKKCPRSLVSQSPEKLGGGRSRLLQEAAAGSSCGWLRREKWQPCPMIFYNHSSLWNHCIMGLRC